MIEVKGISKTFVARGKVRKRVEAVKNVSFTCEPGKIFGLLGPNGAGKTTTMRIIATLLRPDKGVVYVNGVDNQREPKRVRSLIGFLTGDMKVAGNLTCREFLRFFGKLNHLPSEFIESRIEYLSTMLNMRDFLDRTPGKLSSGMKQKLSIAVSLVHDPQVIIFDEPTSSLDVFSAKTVTDFLKEMKRQGKTIIVSTHILPVAERICDVIALMFAGEIVDVGTLEEILKRHSASELEEVFLKYAERHMNLGKVTRHAR